MRTLDIFRAVGGAPRRSALRGARSTRRVAHARSRTMFGGTLADLQLTQATLGDMADRRSTPRRCSTYRAAWLRDVRRDVRTTREAAMAKLAATESAQRVIDAAVQLHGGQGVTRGHDRRAPVPRDPRAAHLRGRDRRCSG